MCLSFLLLASRKLLQKLAHAKSKCSRNTVTVALMNPYCCIYWREQEMSFQKDSKTKPWTLVPSVFTYTGYKYVQPITKIDQIMGVHKKSVSYLLKWKRGIKFKNQNLQWHIKPLKKYTVCTGHSSEILCWWDASELGHHKMLSMKHKPLSLSWEGFCQLKCKSSTRIIEPFS